MQTIATSSRISLRRRLLGTMQQGSRVSLRRLSLVTLVTVLVASACSSGGGVDILAEGERNPDPTPGAATDDPAADEVVAVTPTPAVSATPTERPTPTAFPTPTLVPTSTPIPTPTPLPGPIVIEVPDEVRALVGQEVPAGIEAEVPPGNSVTTLVVEDAPAGLDGTETFTPATVGTWQSTVVATDAFGREVRETIRFVARHPAHTNGVVAMGDSVASGHGLQFSDYFGRDACYRSNDGYPRRVVQGLVRSGVLQEGAELGLVACSGADVDDLFTDTVSGGLSGTGPDGGGGQTQLEWAIRANPRLVLLTIGINDLHFVNPQRLIADGRLIEGVVQERLDQIDAELSRVVSDLLALTDATIVVTGYYNPAAGRPQGVDGCETSCFRAVSDEAVRRMNATIAGALPDSNRALYVDLADAFLGHGAPNGVGPDGARAGAGVLGDLFGSYTEGIQPYCAKGDGNADSWINSVDCVHPNDEGAQVIANLIVAALTSR